MVVDVSDLTVVVCSSYIAVASWCLLHLLRVVIILYRTPLIRSSARLETQLDALLRERSSIPVPCVPGS